MGDILKKIEDIESEMARTQKNKATSAHLGLLKAKLAKLRRELITPKVTFLWIYLRHFEKSSLLTSLREVRQPRKALRWPRLETVG
jgi:hypothetical protein